MVKHKRFIQDFSLKHDCSLIYISTHLNQIPVHTLTSVPTVDTYIHVYLYSLLHPHSFFLFIIWAMKRKVVILGHLLKWLMLLSFRWQPWLLLVRKHPPNRVTSPVLHSGLFWVCPRSWILLRNAIPLSWFFLYKATSSGSCAAREKFVFIRGKSQSWGRLRSVPSYTTIFELY